MNAKYKQNVGAQFQFTIASLRYHSTRASKSRTCPLQAVDKSAAGHGQVSNLFTTCQEQVRDLLAPGKVKVKDP